MGIFENLSGKIPQNQPDTTALFQQFVQNPMQYLAGLNIPPNLSTPEQMVRHLAATNQIPPQLQAMVNAKLRG